LANIPNPKYALLIAGLSLLGFVARRRNSTQRNPLSSAYTDPASAGFFFFGLSREYAAVGGEA
jgi:hypothetical protein